MLWRVAHTWLLHRTYFVKAYGLKNRENKLNPNSLQASGRSSPSCRTPAVGCDADSERPKRRAGNGFPRNKMEMKSNRFSLSTLTGWKRKSQEFRMTSHDISWHLNARWSWWPTKRSKVILIWRAVIQQRSSGFLGWVQNSDIRQRWIMADHGWSWDIHTMPYMPSCHASLRSTKYINSSRLRLSSWNPSP